MKSLILFVLSFTASQALAQAPTSMPCSPSALVLPVLQEPQLSLPTREPLKAFRLSLLTTLGGSALILAGLAADNRDMDGAFLAGLTLGTAAIAVGPSMGHFYNRGYTRGALTTLLRAGAPVAGAFIGGATELFFLRKTGDEYGGSLSAGFAGVVYGGFTGLVVSAALIAYDIVDAPRAVKRGSSKLRDLRWLRSRREQ
jgi:hypothetical protein